MDFKKRVTFENWQYRILPYDIFECLNPKYMDFVTLWQNKKQGRGLPSRADFDFEDFATLFGWVSVYKVCMDPFDMELTLHGTKVADVDLKVKKGMKITELLKHPIEGPYASYYIEQHRQAAEKHLITRSVGSELHNYKACGVEWIGLPCADDGETATHYITLTNVIQMKEIENIVI